MGRRESLIAFIKAISGQVNMLSVPRIYIDLTGDLTLAAMLSQLIYWSDRIVRKDGYIYKSWQDWFDEVGAGRRSIDKFNQLPYIETKLVKANGCPTTHYRVKFDVLYEQLSKMFEIDVTELDPLTMEAKPPCLESPLSLDGGKIAPLSEGDETGIGANLPQYGGENDNSICNNVQMDLYKITNPIVQNDKSLTEITTEITTETTTILKEVQDSFSAYAEPSFEHDQDINSIAEKEEEDQNLNDSTGSHYQAYLRTLSEITGLDLGIKSNAGRLGRATSQLIKAGYSIPDLNGFLNWWMDNDWRWKKDKQMPTPENVLTQISQYKNSSILLDFNRRRYEKWLK